MKPRLSSARPCVTRTSRFDPRGAALESVAAEFALLAQRRARAARQVDLLARQLSAAQASLDAVHARMAMLVGRIDGIDPGLRNGPEQQQPPPAPYYQPAPQPAPAPTRRPYSAPSPTLAPVQTQAPPQPYGANRQMVLARGMRQVGRRRPFLPE